MLPREARYPIAPMQKNGPRRVSLPYAPLVATAAALCAACDPSSPEPPPRNVLLVTIDTLRSDHCSVQGYARKTTPQLERFAGRGARFELAYAPTATTAPTHATILTSLYPIAHGLRKNGEVLNADLRTLAEILKDRGYRTAAVVSSFVLDAKFGFSQGFDAYDDDFEAASATMREQVWQDHEIGGAFDQPANIATDKAIRWLRQPRSAQQPFFLWVHYFDPHAPYVPPEPFASRFTRQDADSDLEAQIAAYDGEIAFADGEIGRLLEFIDSSALSPDTLVVITADHGEGLMQHGHPHHGAQIYEEAVRVPLLVRLPGRVAEGKTFGEPVELVDLLPTVLELTGIEAQGGLEGRSLAGVLEGREILDPLRPVYLHRRHYDPGQVGEIYVSGEMFGIRVGPWKYIEGVEEHTRELFNLENDPGERVNLYEPANAVVLELASGLQAWKKASARATPAPGAPVLSEEDEKRLRALGYLP